MGHSKVIDEIVDELFEELFSAEANSYYDKFVDVNGSVSTNATCLPTAKEYSEAAEKNAFWFTVKWSEPKYQCPECGGGMRKNMMVVLTTYPAKYEYQCDKCGHIDYQYM